MGLWLLLLSGILRLLEPCFLVGAVSFRRLLLLPIAFESPAKGFQVDACCGVLLLNFKGVVLLLVPLNSLLLRGEGILTFLHEKRRGS